MKKFIRIPVLLAFLLCNSGFAQPVDYYPPPSSVTFHNDTLTICPPDSLPGDPVELLFYNIFIDDVFFDNIQVFNPTDTVKHILDSTMVTPGNHIFCVSAVYNLWISVNTCDSALIQYGFDLPFPEDWSSGSFENQLWIADDHWEIEITEGNPAPCARITFNQVPANYEIILESHALDATEMSIGVIWMDFDIKLDAEQSSGTEKLFVQGWNWVTQSWTTFAEYDNSDGSFGWFAEHLNIKAHTLYKVFKVRFLASGQNPSEIAAWYIDNIEIYRHCFGITELHLDENEDFNMLYWIGPDGCWPVSWIEWDDGYFSGISIGTGDPVEFDVAAKWLPSHIDEFEGGIIDKIAFVPTENQADYNIRLWKGAAPDSLILDQPVEAPVIGQWNYIVLENPVLLDVTQTLWAGYHISTPTGYPAGADDGPAIDGYGNMMYFDSTWSTLLEINPELDYNWNIAVHLAPPYDPDHPRMRYNVYRQVNNGDFMLYDTTLNQEYIDSNILLSDYYCYLVTLQSYSPFDTCESSWTEQVCESINLGVTEDKANCNIAIFPNPTNKWLNIESQNVIREIRLYNSLGETVMKLEIGNLDYKLDVSNLPSGIYFIEIKTRESETRSKIIVGR